MKNISKKLKLFTMSLLVTVTVVPSAYASPSQSLLMKNKLRVILQLLSLKL